MSPKTEKLTVISFCVLGVSGVAFGMVSQNDTVFVIGIVFVIFGYLFIRKKLKESVGKPS